MNCNLIYVINESYDDTRIHDIFNNSYLFMTYHKKNIILSHEYSYFKSAINCIIRHPYLKIFNNEYCYVESEKIINEGYYPCYERFHMLLGLLWDSIKQKDIQNIIDCYYDILGDLNKITNFDRYYPHYVINYIFRYIYNAFALEFYEDKSFVKSIENELNTNKAITTNIVKKILNETKLNSLFITPGHGRPFIYRSSFNSHVTLFEYDYIKNDKDFLDKINNIKNKVQNEINETSISGKSNFFDYVIDNFYLQSFVFIDKDFNCVYVKIKYDDNFNIVKRVRYDDNKLTYDENNNLIKDELNIFNKFGISDYYGNDNFYKIDLICYVRKHLI